MSVPLRHFAAEKLDLPLELVEHEKRLDAVAVRETHVRGDRLFVVQWLVSREKVVRLTADDLRRYWRMERDGQLRQAGLLPPLGSDRAHG